MEIMKLWNTFLAPASDTLLDLGASTARWNNLFLRGTNSSTTISANSVNTTILVSLSSYLVGAAVTGMTVNSMSSVAVTASSLVLSNSAKAYMNVKMLTHNAAGILSGDVYFFASSNRVYLGINSQSATYFIAMDT